MNRENNYRRSPSEEEYLRVDQGLPIRSRSRPRSPRLQREFSYDSGYSSSCLEHASETSHSPRDSRYERRGSFSRQLGPKPRVVRSRPVSPQPSTESYPSDSVATADCSSQGSNMHVSGHDSSCFHYRELRAKEIRLLQLEPTTTTMIKYKPLFYTTIDNPPPYVAISYAWGDVHNQKGIPVQVGAHPLKITESLHGALKALAHQAEVSVWADSVCIYPDQSQTKHLNFLRSFVLRIWLVGSANIVLGVFKWKSMNTSSKFDLRVALPVLRLNITTYPCFETAPV
jgi:hypothetical protein